MTQFNDPLEPKPGGVTRGALIKRGLLGAGALSGAALLAACGDDSSSGGSTAAAATTAKATTGKARKLIWACAALDPSFLPIEVGFVDACNALGWKFQKVGVPSAQYSPEMVVSVARQAIQAKPDVIVTSGWVKGGYAAYEEAQKAGILVILHDANNSPADGARLHLGHVGSDEKNNGVVMANALIAQAKKNGKTGGTLIFGNGFPGNANLEAHGAGLKEAAARSGFKVVVYKEPVDPVDVISGYKAQLTKIGDDLVGILGNANPPTPIVKALQESGKKPGEIVHGTFNDSSASLDLLKQGWVTTVVSHQFYSWGFVPTMLAFQALERNVAPREYLTGGQVMDATNVDAAIAQAQELEQLATKYGIKFV